MVKSSGPALVERLSISMSSMCWPVKPPGIATVSWPNLNSASNSLRAAASRSRLSFDRSGVMSTSTVGWIATSHSSTAKPPTTTNRTWCFSRIVSIRAASTSGTGINALVFAQAVLARLDAASWPRKQSVRHQAVLRRSVPRICRDHPTVRAGGESQIPLPQPVVAGWEGSVPCGPFRRPIPPVGSSLREKRVRVG